jgi:DNA primase
MMQNRRQVNFQVKKRMAFSKFSPGSASASEGAQTKPTFTGRPNFRFSKSGARRPAEKLKASDVLEKTDLVSLIGEVVELRSRGPKEMIGLCPFHGDSTPSFEVNAAKGIYSCWSCSAGLNGSRGGDAITFVQRYHNMDFREALYYLARRAGMRVPDDAPDPIASGRPAPAFVPRQPSAPTGPAKREPNLKANKQPLYEVMEVAQNLFSSHLASNTAIIRYLTQERGIDPSLLGKYRIGYAPDDFGALRSVVSDYNSNDAIFDAGLVKESDRGKRYDFFRDRLMFGVRDNDGRIVAFGGRRIGEGKKKDAKGNLISIAKYMNSPETAIFSKSEVLFGWYEAKEAAIQDGYALMVEGYMDVLGLASQGVMNAAACMGTALTEQHVQTVLGTVKRLVFCFDGDNAGQQAGFRSLSALFPYLDNDVNVRFLTLADEQDPDEYVRKHGRAQFLKEVNNCADLAQFWESALRRLYPEEKDRKQMWDNARDLVDLLPKDSHHSGQLLQIAARLSGHSAPKRQRGAAPHVHTPSPRAQCSGLSSFVANEPSERLCLAVYKMPELAAQMRPRLLDQHASVTPKLRSALSDWQAKFDQAMYAGMSTSPEQRGTLSEAERRQYEAVIGASQSILSQFLGFQERKMLDQALEAGELDEADYLSKLRQSTFARPR